VLSVQLLSQVIIIIIVRRFLTRRNMLMTLQGRASTYTVDECHTVSAAVQSEESNRYRVLMRLYRCRSTEECGCDVDAVNGEQVARRVDFIPQRSALKDANLSCGSGRPM